VSVRAGCLAAILIQLAIPPAEAQRDSARSDTLPSLSKYLFTGFSPYSHSGRLSLLDQSPLFDKYRSDTYPDFLPFLPTHPFDPTLTGPMGFGGPVWKPVRREDIDGVFEQYRLSNVAQARAIRTGGLIGGVTGILVGASLGEGSSVGQRAVNALIGGGVGMLVGQGVGITISAKANKSGDK
jgi:hypothetical protein